jgi:predicted RND superfamily exporter protein
MAWTARHFSTWVVRYRWWIILLAAPHACISAAGLARITISNDTHVFFGEHNPDYQALKALENTYGRTHGLFFILAPKDGHVFTRKTLAAAFELTESAWEIPRSISVSSITNFPVMRPDGNDLTVEDLVADPCALSDAALQRVRQTALSEPSLVKA